MKIVIDTREQTPWSFPDDVEVEIGTVRQGDYCLAGDNTFSIERKSMTDFRGTVVREWDRFQRELQRMDRAGFSSKVVVVECDFVDYCFTSVLNKDRFKSAADAERAYATYASGRADPSSFAEWLWTSAEDCVQPAAGEDQVFTPAFAAMRVAELLVWNRTAVLFAHDENVAAAVAFQLFLQRQAQLSGKVAMPRQK